MAKRPIGFAQMFVMLGGFGVFLGYFMWFFVGLLRAAGDYTADLAAFQRLAWSKAWIAAAGLGLCGLAWLWALASSISILREARVSRPPPVP